MCSVGAERHLLDLDERKCRRRFRDGVGVKLEGPAKAVAGDTVTVTATLTGKADNETSFTLTGLESAYANTFDKVTKSGKDTLKIAKDADFGSVGLNVQFTFTMPDSAATITVTAP